MGDLILRPSGLEEKHNKPWCLQLRFAGMPATEYHTLCYVSDDTAQQIMEAGEPYWLFGEPDWLARARARDMERARVLREEAARIEQSATEGTTP
ncbi:MAG: hypothetical protein ACAH27_06040 [Xanthobacteraceae bacterium]